jgi:hypothetical protein
MIFPGGTRHDGGWVHGGLVWVFVLPGSNCPALDSDGRSSEGADGYVRQMAGAIEMDHDGRSVTRAAAWQHGVTVRLPK